MKMELTHRERQIMELLCDGKTHHQIALDLKISPKTVESYLTRLYRKLGVHNRSSAVAVYAPLWTCSICGNLYRWKYHYDFRDVIL